MFPTCSNSTETACLQNHALTRRLALWARLIGRRSCMLCCTCAKTGTIFTTACISSKRLSRAAPNPRTERRFSSPACRVHPQTRVPSVDLQGLPRDPETHVPSSSGRNFSGGDGAGCGGGGNWLGNWNGWLKNVYPMWTPCVARKPRAYSFETHMHGIIAF